MAESPDKSSPGWQVMTPEVEYRVLAGRAGEASLQTSEAVTRAQTNISNEEQFPVSCHTKIGRGVSLKSRGLLMGLPTRRFFLVAVAGLVSTVCCGKSRWDLRIAVQDLNRDGVSDVVIVSPDVNVRVFLGHGDGTFAEPVSYITGLAPKDVQVADLDGDNVADIVTTNMSSVDMSVLHGRGDGSFSKPDSHPTGMGSPEGVAVGDLNADGIPDIVTANFGSGNVSVLLGQGQRIFATPVFYPAGGSPTCVAIADLNGDHITDIVVGNSYSRDLSVLLGRGDGTLMSPQNYGVEGSPSSVIIANLTGDGIPDVVTTTSYPGNVTVLKGQGNGTLSVMQTYETGSRTEGLAVADLNGDGGLDLVVAVRQSGYVSVLANQGAGTPSEPVFYGAGAEPSDLAVAEINGDKFPDLVVADAGSGNVIVLAGRADGTFGPQVQVGPNWLRRVVLSILGLVFVVSLAIAARKVFGVRTKTFFKNIAGLLLVLFGAFVVIFMVPMVAMADGGGVASHFLAMIVYFGVGSIGIIIGARSSEKKIAGWMLILVGALLSLFGTLAGINSFTWAFRRPDIWAFHTGDLLFWLLYLACGVTMFRKGLSRLRHTA